MESAPTDRGNPAANRKPRVAATHVGAHIVRPGNPAADRKPRATATHVGAHIVRPGNPAANRKPRVAATHVGDDARIVPGTPRYRKVPREGHDPPLQTPANARPNGMAPPTRATVGRDALIPPHPAAAQTPAGGMNPAPTDRGNPAANRNPRVAATHVGDDARIVPGTPRYRKVPREGHDPPLQTPANARPNGMAPPTRATVGRDALIPPHPAAAQTPAGGMNPAPTDRGNPAANRKPRATATHVGAHIVRPGNPAADRKPRVAATYVGDDARIVPGTPRCRKVPREGHDPPLQTPANARSNGMAPRTRTAVGRDALIPPDPAASQTHVGADSISARLAAAQGLVGGMPAAHPKPIQKLYAPLTVPPAGRLVFWAPGCYNYTVG